MTANVPDPHDKPVLAFARPTDRSWQTHKPRIIGTVKALSPVSTANGEDPMSGQEWEESCRQFRARVDKAASRPG